MVWNQMNCSLFLKNRENSWNTPRITLKLWWILLHSHPGTSSWLPLLSRGPLLPNFNAKGLFESVQEQEMLISFSNFHNINSNVQSVHSRQKLSIHGPAYLSRSDRQKTCVLFHNNTMSLKGGLGMMEGGVGLNSYFLLPLNVVLIFFSKLSI